LVARRAGVAGERSDAVDAELADEREQP
jgi:hypothetical protein